MGKLTIDYQKLHDAFFKYVHESTNMIICVIFTVMSNSMGVMSHSRIILEWDFARACVSCTSFSDLNSSCLIYRWQTKPKMSIHGDLYYEVGWCTLNSVL